MQLGMVGLGKMGGNMSRRLARGGHQIVAFDLDAARVAEFEKEGMKGATDLGKFVAQLEKPRVAWLMVPAGDATESMVNKLAALFEAGDILIDGGNSYFKDDVRRAAALKAKGIHYADVGTSGGVWGLDRGYCLMIGADKEVFAHLEPIFKTLAPGMSGIPSSPGRATAGRTAHEGYLHCGPNGAGHFVKMVHNGIEYGLMQAYGEGFDIMKNARSKDLPEAERYNLDLGEIAELWRRGSVVASWLLDLTAIALAEDPALAQFTGFVQDSGEGRWTIQAAIEESVPADVLTAALYVRFRSRQEHTFAEKMLSAMRKQFGGHIEQHAAVSK
ncbi:MAG TPA: decarboxylating 6-phosphogluconate dehydrogenase [Bryobacteraceae bacterium]|nr:decarboxylating 6-phosphogluconate dehydrogenase [Bryobacteraceae bacterium]